MSEAKSNISSLEFAGLILLAQAIKEKSWRPKHVRYDIDDNEAALLACGKLRINPVWASPVAFLNIMSMNDAAMWAREQRNEKTSTSFK